MCDEVNYLLLTYTNLFYMTGKSDHTRPKKIKKESIPMTHQGQTENTTHTLVHIKQLTHPKTSTNTDIYNP